MPKGRGPQMLRWMVKALLFLTTSNTYARQSSVAEWSRDWQQHPVIECRAPHPRVFAVSDIHGRLDVVVHLLVANKLIEGSPGSAGSSVWKGGNALLGEVIALFGNHEAEFLDQPFNHKATKKGGLSTEILAQGGDPLAVATGRDPLGVWLRSLPFAAIVGNWFFAHAGNTQGRTPKELALAVREDVALHDFHGREIIGSESLLESRDWISQNAVEAERKALGVRHIVFGHQPHALGPAGRIVATSDGALFRIDTGLAHRHRTGELLFVHTEAQGEVAEALDENGKTRLLWKTTHRSTTALHQ